MAGLAVDGLISGMDTTSLINQLIQAEAGQQTQLKTKLATAQTAASAYRTVNTTFLAVTTAAETALKADTWSATKANSSSPNVAVSSSSSAAPGSLSFTVGQLATAHSVVRQDASWTSADADFGATSLTVTGADGVADGTLTFAAGASLTEVATAINASTYGLSAAVVQVDTNKYALQVTAKKTGADNSFTLGGGGAFDVNTQGQNAKITIGTTTPYTVSSATNTFSSVLPGTTLTVNEADPAKRVTVDVTSDPDAVASQMQKLVDAVNSALTQVKTYTSNATGSTAALRGDYSVSSLGGQLLDAVAYAVGGDGSPARIGLQLSKDGKVTFDKAKFTEALAADPTLPQRMVAGRTAGAGDDGVSGTADDVTAVTGIAARLLSVSKAASDSATGSLTKLAEGQDSNAKDLQERIDAWDLRLATRKEALTRQFSAMETALSSLQNQSTWLAGQINSLPSYS
jgi:flagellar capping protein FliD